MTGIRRILTALVLSAIFVTGGLAQTQTQTQTTPATSTAAAPAPSFEFKDSHTIREEFKQLLDKYPPDLGKVLKLDSTLLSNQPYLANYPALASFITQHPEVAHNPRFFLASVWVGDAPPQSSGERVWHDMMEGITIFVVMFSIIGVLTWLIRTVITHRKWSRVSKLQAEVHTKILDRFSTSEELLAYVQTPAGKRFLESAPIPLDAEAQVSAPVSRILWSVQVGIVLAAVGIGLFFISVNIEKEMAPPMFAMGALALAVGAGFVLSAIVSFAISRKLGLWQSPAEARTTLAE